MSIRLQTVAGDTAKVRFRLKANSGQFDEDATYTCEVYSDTAKTTLVDTLTASYSPNGGLMFSPTVAMVAGTYFIRIKQLNGSNLGTIGGELNQWIVI